MIKFALSSVFSFFCSDSSPNSITHFLFVSGFMLSLHLHCLFFYLFFVLCLYHMTLSLTLAQFIVCSFFLLVYFFFLCSSDITTNECLYSYTTFNFTFSVHKQTSWPVDLEKKKKHHSLFPSFLAASFPPPRLTCSLHLWAAPPSPPSPCILPASLSLHSLSSFPSAVQPLFLFHLFTSFPSSPASFRITASRPSPLPHNQFIPLQCFFFQHPFTSSRFTLSL